MNLQRSRGSGTLGWDWRAALSAGRLAMQSGDLPRAERSIRQALELAREAGEAGGEQDALNALGVALTTMERLDEAEEAFRRLLAQARDPSDGARIAGMSNLAQVLTRRGRPEEATELLRALLSELARGQHPMEWAAAQNNLAVALSALGQSAEAVAHLRGALATLTETEGAAHPRAIELKANLGQALISAGNMEEGKSLLEAAAHDATAALGEDHTLARTARAALEGASRA